MVVLFGFIGVITILYYRGFLETKIWYYLAQMVYGVCVCAHAHRYGFCRLDSLKKMNIIVHALVACNKIQQGTTSVRILIWLISLLMEMTWNGSMLTTSRTRTLQHVWLKVQWAAMWMSSPWAHHTLQRDTWTKSYRKSRNSHSVHWCFREKGTPQTDPQSDPQTYPSGLRSGAGTNLRRQINVAWPSMLRSARPLPLPLAGTCMRRRWKNHLDHPLVTGERDQWRL